MRKPARVSNRSGRRADEAYIAVNRSWCSGARHRSDSTVGSRSSFFSSTAERTWLTELTTTHAVIQTARLSGFAPIITTASTHNTALLLALGATHVLDRHLPAPALLAAVRAITPAPIELIYDAISLEETQRVAYELLAPGGQLILVLPSVIDGDEIDPGLGKRVKRVSGSAWPPESRKVGARLWGALTTLLKEGAIKVRF